MSNAQASVKNVRPIPHINFLMDFYKKSIPYKETTLVHGDYKFDNIMFVNQNTPQIIGVLDWELSTLGLYFYFYVLNY